MKKRKRKVVKELVVHFLLEDDLEKTGEQVREEAEEAWEVVVNKWEEMKESLKVKLIML